MDYPHYKVMRTGLPCGKIKTLRAKYYLALNAFKRQGTVCHFQRGVPFMEITVSMELLLGIATFQVGYTAFLYTFFKDIFKAS